MSDLGDLRDRVRVTQLSRTVPDFDYEAEAIRVLREAILRHEEAMRILRRESQTEILRRLLP